jgi:hypothetical protein
MMQLIEGTNYKKRHEQPTPAPHDSNEVFDFLLYSDPGDDDDAQVPMFARKGQWQLGKQSRFDGFS